MVPSGSDGTSCGGTLNAEVAFHQSLGSRVLRRAEHVEGVPLLHHHTILHNRYTVEDLLGYIQLVCDEHDSNAQLAIDALQ